MSASSWFEDLTGFREEGYEATRNRLEVGDGRIRSKVNGQSYATGELETPSLRELRTRVQNALPRLAGQLTVSCISGDVRDLHRHPANASALFQVASQFNLLEMSAPTITPEDGVTRYAFDPTQGPACAVAAGAATIYRNYFASVDGLNGQTRQRQIDCLRDLGADLGNERQQLWTMRNGYAQCTEKGLSAIRQRLDAATGTQIGALRDRLRIGVHWNVEVTDGPSPRHCVSQAFCSALPVSYSPAIAVRQWQAFATLILEGAYEATLWAATQNAQRFSSNVVFLTQLGGGAFGNDRAWIYHALRRSLDLFRNVALDVRLVSHGPPPAELVDLAACRSVA